MSFSRSATRTARKDHQCYGCLGPIKKGEQYNDFIASPGWADIDPWNWLRWKECADCAERHGRVVA